MAFFDFVKGFLSGGIINLLVYAIIVLIFIFGLIRCVFPVLRNRRILKRAMRDVRAGNSAKRSWQDAEFLGEGSLLDHWSEYLNNLFFADGVYHNASSMEDYVNEETVIFGPGRGSFAEAVPGLLVSVGFLGTLIGLAQGLSGFSMSDSQAVMDSIVTLIPGMRYAFMTSIVGVVCSVLFTLIIRSIYGSTEHTLRNFYGAMSHYAGLSSVDPMTQVAIYQQEQTAMIRKMAEDLSGKLTDNIAAAVGRAVEPLNNSLRNFVSVTTKDQMRFLDAVVMRVLDRMDDLLGGQIKRLSRAMEESAARQEHTIGMVQEDMDATADMVKSMREVIRIADDMVRVNAEYIRDLRENQRQTDDAFNRVASSVEQMDLVTRQQTNYLKSVSSMQAEVSNSMEQMSSAMKDFTQRVGELSANSSAGLLSAAAELRATGAHLQEIHRECASGITEELKLTLDAYEEYVNQFTQRVDYLAGGISDSLSKLPPAVDESANAFLDQVDRLSNSLARAQQMLDETVERLRDEPYSRR